jgi:hypothetical protein
MTPEEHYLALACLASGFILGLCGGLRIGFALLDNLRRRIEQLERGVTHEEVAG